MERLTVSNKPVPKACRVLTAGRKATVVVVCPNHGPQRLLLGPSRHWQSHRCPKCGVDSRVAYFACAGKSPEDMSDIVD